MSVDFDLLIPLDPPDESFPATVTDLAEVAPASASSLAEVPAESASVPHLREAALPVSERGTITLRVEEVRREAEGVNSFLFADPSGRELPEWQPGDHLDVHLPSGTIRQYSLCGDIADRTTYRVAVLEQPAGRGGSVEVHRELRPGRLVELGEPRSNFALEDADEYVFIAGGIGITPIWAMVQSATDAGVPWTLHFGAKSRDHFAFLPALRRCADQQLGSAGQTVRDGHVCGDDPIRLSADDETGRMDLAAIVAETPNAQIYCCGPAPLMDTLTELMDEDGRAEALHVERFTVDPLARVGAADDSDGSVDTFDVELARTGGTISVGADETVLEAVRRAGVDHPSSCEMGICGTCETRVVAGEIDHRDDLLTDAEKQRGDCMMICVSRSKCPKLVLDL